MKNEGYYPITKHPDYADLARWWANLKNDPMRGCNNKSPKRLEKRRKKNKMAKNSRKKNRKS